MFNLIADKIIKAIQLKLKDNDSYASGNLVNDITPIITDTNISIEMEGYAEYVDGGTRPHMPPVNPIKKWIELKGLTINPWAVAMNIKKYGTKANKFLYIIDDLDFSTIIDDYVISKIEGLEFKDKVINLRI